jgi:hypothetical protein
MENRIVKSPTKKSVGFILSGMGRPQRKDVPSTQPGSFFMR